MENLQTINTSINSIKMVNEMTGYIFGNNNSNGPGAPLIYKTTNGGEQPVPEIINNNTFSLFPNPAKDIFFIEPSSDIKAVKILNELGQLVTQKYCCFEKGINISHLKNGLYYIEILSKKGYTNHKIIKE